MQHMHFMMTENTLCFLLVLPFKIGKCLQVPIAGDENSLLFFVASQPRSDQTSHTKHLHVDAGVSLVGQ